MTTEPRETRELAVADLEFRAEGDGFHSSGYPALFGIESSLISDPRLGQFVEVIEPGAFARSLADGHNIKLDVDHNPEKLLASTATGRLQLKEDGRGLRHEASHAQTSYARDLKVLADAQEIRSMSFVFRPTNKGEKWSDGRQKRMLSEVRLYSISILTGKDPAYPQTTAYIRSLAETLEADPDDLTLVIAALSEGRALSDAEANLLQQAIDATRATPKPLTIPISIAERRAALDTLEATFRKSPESSIVAK